MQLQRIIPNLRISQIIITSLLYNGNYLYVKVQQKDVSMDCGMKNHVSVIVSHHIVVMIGENVMYLRQIVVAILGGSESLILIIHVHVCVGLCPQPMHANFAIFLILYFS